MSRISKDEVKKVAELARIKLDDVEVAHHADQLDKILDYINQLEKIDTEDVPCTTRAIEMINVLRTDKSDLYKSRKDILNLAPAKENSFYKVPKIIKD